MNIFAQLARRSAHAPMNIAHVRLWHFVTSVEEAIQPALRTSPLVVVHGHGDTSRILDANDLARSVGVRVGMPTAVAQRRVPNLIIRSWNPHRVEGFTRAFRTLAKQWGTVQSMALDTQSAALAIPGTSALERAAIFLHIQQACWRELESNVVVGMGPTSAFAYLAARSCPEPGFRYIDLNETATLRTVPIASIPNIGRRTARALVRLGLPTAWHFLQVDAATILHHGGPTLLRIYRRFVPEAQLLPIHEVRGVQRHAQYLQQYSPLPVAAL